MKKLKNPTAGILTATMIFSNVQPLVANGEENQNQEYSVEINKEGIYKNIEDSEIVNIPDTIFKSKINSHLGKNGDEDITRSELESLEYLDISYTLGI